MPVDPPVGLFLGLATLDILYSVTGPPKPNSKNVARRQALYAGGPATNAAATFSALGGRAYLAAILGGNPLAAAIKEDLQRNAVHLIDLLPQFGGEPSFSSILVDENSGERVVISANATRLPPPALPEGLLDLTRPAVLLLDGHLMEPAKTAAQRAREIATTVVFDGGSWKDGTDTLLPFVDIAICSEDFHPPGTTSELEAIEYLKRRGIERCAITRGAKPLWFSDSGRVGEIYVSEVDVVDTLGAGDVFHGAFCYYYVACGGNFRTALQHAAEVASFKCRFFGTREWMKEYSSTTV